jgi:uncharacterized protein (DUF1800 family)
MEKAALWSLRLGFTTKQSKVIEKKGIEAFVMKSFTSDFSTEIPNCLKDSPKSIKDIRENKKQYRDRTDQEKRKIIKTTLIDAFEIKKWWIDEIRKQEFPLREKMTLFWHNHFVSTSQKVKVNWWIYQHNTIVRENAFGNFRELTKKIIKSNAMIEYLDNQDNRRNKLNENLSRELLELFTIGIGNYTENDIKNGAKALAGLLPNDIEGTYRPNFENSEEIEYFGKKGIFKADDLIDIIFQQQQTPYLIVRKILKWFIYDNPEDDLVKYYGDYFRQIDFEIQPLLTKIISEEFSKDTSGSKIKNPLEYILQLTDTLNCNEIDSESIYFFIKQQGMDLYDQPNVKGWDGGNSWLTSQIYLQRNNVSDLLCSGRTISRKALNNMENKTVEPIAVSIKYNPNDSPQQIIKNLIKLNLFEVNIELQKDFETILKYDFDPKSNNANEAILRLFNFMTKTPEYQLI